MKGATRELDQLTFMYPDDCNSDHDEKVIPLQEKGVPQTKLGMKGNGVGE